MLLRGRQPNGVALLAIALLVTSPFIYSFSRLAMVKSLLVALTLGALNLAVRLPEYSHPVRISGLIGLFIALMMLTKPTAAFLLPALAWACVRGLWKKKKLVLRCALMAGGVSTIIYGLWLGLVIKLGYLTDYQYLFIINRGPELLSLFGR
jgi:4-amino-4-deoxy-L-arabinose transferase-like glycosyltransferase